MFAVKSREVMDHFGPMVARPPIPYFAKQDALVNAFAMAETLWGHLAVVEVADESGRRVLKLDCAQRNRDQFIGNAGPTHPESGWRREYVLWKTTALGRAQVADAMGDDQVGDYFVTSYSRGKLRWIQYDYVTQREYADGSVRYGAECTSVLGRKLPGGLLDEVDVLRGDGAYHDHNNRSDAWKDALKSALTDVAGVLHWSGE
ncbi:hypothetical protein ACFWAP_00870 [Streptomyces goshikiensis]|uniref:hypothetical protein n=1 Tax=Streptomyces goshikiensis TaxID=1942 RepID=UPI0036625FE2